MEASYAKRPALKWYGIALHSSDLTVRLLIPVRLLSPGMRGVTDRLTRYVADKILRDRVLNYTSDTLALWCSIPGDKFFYRQY